MSFVYFVHAADVGLVKIGVAGNPRSRLSKIQSDAPCAVVMIGVEPGDVSREAELHSQFATLRQRGEWFRAEPLLLDYIAALPPMQVSVEPRPYGCAQMSRETGWGKTYCYYMLTGQAPITLERAAHIYLTTGHKMGPFEEASDDEVAIVARLAALVDGAARRQAA